MSERIRRTRKGWVVETHSNQQGDLTDHRALVRPADVGLPHDVDLDAEINAHGTTAGDRIWFFSTGPLARILRRGHVVR